MDPTTILALGSGVASLASGVLGHFGQRSANAQSLSNMREQNAFQERLWRMTNDYNDPSAQRKRYEQAGINPYMALGSITPGIAQSGSPTAPVGVENELSPLGQGIQGAGNQIVNAYLQNQLISSQVEKNLADAEAVKSDIPYIGRRNETNIANTEANTTRTHTQTELDKVNTMVASASLDRIKQMTPVEVQMMRASAESATATASYTKLQQLISEFDLKHLKPLEAQEAKARVSQVYAMTGYLVAQGRLSQEQAGLVAKMALTEVTREEGIYWDNMLKRDDYGRAESKFWHEMDNMDAQTSYYKDYVSKSDSRELREWTGVVVNAVSTFSGRGGYVQPSNIMSSYQQAGRPQVRRVVSPPREPKVDIRSSFQRGKGSTSRW